MVPPLGISCVWATGHAVVGQEGWVSKSEEPASASTTELAKTPSSDRAILRRYGDSIARSPMAIGPGEAVLIGRAGKLFGRVGFRRRLLLWKVGVNGALLGGAGLMLAGATLPGLGLYLAGLTPTFLVRYRGTRTVLVIELLVRQGKLDEAQQRFAAAPELRRRNPAAHHRITGTLAAARGERAQALASWRQALPLCRGLQAELIRLQITRTLLQTGQAEAARREFGNLRLPPDIDEFVYGIALTRAMFVLLDPASASTPVEELHDWARAALAYSHTGTTLGVLGMVFARIGDDEMARFLAAEAVARAHDPYLAVTWPELHAWLAAHAPTADAADAG